MSKIMVLSVLLIVVLIVLSYLSFYSEEKHQPDQSIIPGGVVV
ncbi:hypothetical protein [Neorickettsia sennetsu]|uniref:Uncharacterized protein n=1 Tax=Ehrlichia sennetsu (strain ATCC VR-367 / Miyayama) TaxID=222891 RepID=Q2GE90_EHRS3|nr:hypothetical protein [Neorickettsia sennetsu]ABD46227.1 hypothetical protein NSE_0316 [Neorickettsia sennetsu str. Miyayama]